MLTTSLCAAIALTATTPPRATVDRSKQSVAATALGAVSTDFATVMAEMDRARRELQERVTPSIVTVNTYIKVPEGVAFEGRWQVADESPFPGYAREKVASGILLDDKGTILCCRDPLTLDGDTFAEVYEIDTPTGARFECELVASEPTINLGILRVKLAEGQTLGDLVPATIGKADTVQLGDTVFAAADPFGSARTFSQGTVMALPTASCYQADLTGSFIHSSMSIAPGAIGGALVNAKGEVVGILVPPPSTDRTVRPDPHPYVTYALQIDTALGVGQALIEKRSNHSPWVGFSVLSQAELRERVRDGAKFDGMAKPNIGIYVDDLYDPSPAAKAGIRRGDFILEINGRKIASVVDFQQSLYYFSGSTVPVRYFRDGKELLAMVTIERRPVNANRP
ncbi:MAG: S1C family serine protease [Limnohabitans sp.]|nr:S1C family serine protease [Limnohabitans sp.]